MRAPNIRGYAALDFISSFSPLLSEKGELKILALAGGDKFKDELNEHHQF